MEAKSTDNRRGGTFYGKYSIPEIPAIAIFVSRGAFLAQRSSWESLATSSGGFFRAVAGRGPAALRDRAAPPERALRDHSQPG